MLEIILGLGVLLVAAAVAWVVHLAPAQVIGAGAVRVLAVACGVGLVVMFITDWPWELLAEFWAEHSVVAGTVSTVLLVGVVFLVFEDGERRAQKQLDDSVTAAGLGGIVDHLVDVEVALALVSNRLDPGSEGWEKWSAPERPLRWLREHRGRLHRALDGPGPNDPRANPVDLPSTDECGGRRSSISACGAFWLVCATGDR